MSTLWLRRLAFLSPLNILRPLFGTWRRSLRLRLLNLACFCARADVAPRFFQKSVNLTLRNHRPSQVGHRLDLPGVKLPVSPSPLFAEHCGKLGRREGDFFHAGEPITLSGIKNGNFQVSRIGLETVSWDSVSRILLKIR